MGSDGVKDTQERGRTARAGGSTADEGARNGRRVLSTYAAMGTGPFELITAAIGRLVDKTRRAPEPIRRILWGQTH